MHYNSKGYGIFINLIFKIICVCDCSGFNAPNRSNWNNKICINLVRINIIFN